MPNEVEITITSKDQSAKGFRDATESVEEYGKGLDAAGEKADGAERNLIGMHDVIDGTATIMQGPGKAGIAGYIQGWADLAGGLAPLLPALSALTLSNIRNTAATIASTVAQKSAAVAGKAWAGAQWVLNAALSANPIAIVIIAVTALVAAIILAYKHSETFRNIVQAAGRAASAAFHAVLSAVQNVIGWIRRNWPLLLGILTGPIGLALVLISRHLDKIVGWVKGLGGRIRGAAAGMWDGITSAFKSAINTIIRGWNSLSFTVPGFTLPFPPHTHFGGFTLGVPPIQQLARGGIASGLAVVGENGRELVDLPTGSRVRTNADTERMLAAGGPGGPMRLQVEVVGDASNWLVQAIRQNIRFKLLPG